MSEDSNVAHDSKTSQVNKHLDPSRLLGFTGFFAMISLAVCLGSDIGIFINLPSIIVCFGGMFMLSILTFSIKDVVKASLLIRYIFTVTSIPVERFDSIDIKILRGMIVHLYAAGAIGVFIGAVQMLAALDDPGSIGPAVAVALLCPFYSLLIAEGILRPMAHHLDHRLSAEDRSE